MAICPLIPNTRSSAARHAATQQAEKVGHTPGPWTRDAKGFVVGRDGIPLMSLERPADERNANALIIEGALDVLAALKSAVTIAEEAREAWDAAPNEVRAGKLLIALAGDCPGYRADIDAIHATIAKAEAR